MTYKIVYTTSDGTIREHSDSDGELMTFNSPTGAQNFIDNTPDIPRDAQVKVYYTSQNDDNDEERARAEQEKREREEREQEEKKRAEAEQEKRERERERERERRGRLLDA